MFFYFLHNTGRVYNMTPYLEYHPGGIPEIMRGVGRDATDLFDEVNTLYSAFSPPPPHPECPLFLNGMSRTVCAP